MHLDEAGRIDQLTALVRPLSAAVALSEQRGARLDRVRELATVYDAPLAVMTRHADRCSRTWA